MPRAIAALLLLLPALAGCGGAPQRPNVLLVVVDTLRADRLGCYGNTRGLTPWIDALAERGYRLEHAFAHAPWTLPSTASLLTSTYPQEHGAGGVVGRFTRLREDLPTLAERLRDAGYRTGTFVNVDFLGEAFGLTRGFEHVDAQYYQTNDEVRSATETTDLALDWIGAGRAPFFALVHYFDAHAVYDPPLDFRRRFASERDRQDPSFTFGTREEMALLRQGKLQVTAKLMKRVAQLYDAEVAYVDSQVGRLLGELEARGLAEDTIVVLTSDHGEEFFDHGGFEHGHTLYSELMHVPLVIAWPGAVPAGSSTQLVGLIDVAPTVCELVGLSPPQSFRGRSLAPLLRGVELAPRPILGHGNFWGPPLSSFSEDEQRLIVTPVVPPGGQAHLRRELYAWRSDPRELEDLAASEPERAAQLEVELAAAQAALARGAGAEVELDAQALERLRVQGYAGGEDED